MQRNGYIGRYTIWIEAEVWDPNDWTPENTNSDVIVTFANRSRWAATCFSYANVASLATQYRETGENLSGTYVWASDMLLVREVSRPRIEGIVAHLLHENTFKQIFTRLPDADDDDLEWQRLNAER